MSSRALVQKTLIPIVLSGVIDSSSSKTFNVLGSQYVYNRSPSDDAGETVPWYRPLCNLIGLPKINKKYTSGCRLLTQARTTMML